MLSSSTISEAASPFKLFLGRAGAQNKLKELVIAFEHNLEGMWSSMALESFLDG